MTGSANGGAAAGAGSAVVEGSGARLLALYELVLGELWVSVYATTFDTQGGPLAAWTYVSDGLWGLSQKEIVFSIKREAEEAESDYNRELLSLYATIQRLAQQGRIVDVNGDTQLSMTGDPLLGRTDFRCVMYMRGQAVPGVEIRAPFLSAVVVTLGEIELARSLGYMRLQSRLGMAARYYPAPPWTDRKRAEVVEEGEVAENPLAAAMRIALRGVSVSLEREGGLASGTGTDSFFAPGDRLVLRVSPRGADDLKRAAAAKEMDGGMLFLLESDPGADACFVWSPGQTGPAAITRPGATGERLCGNYLLLSPGDSPSATAFQDGFSLVLDEAGWKRAREAMVAGERLSIPGKDAVPAFVIEPVSAAEMDPFDD